MQPDQIKTLANQLSDEIIAIRRTIHANPEVSFREFKTAEFVESILDHWGIGHQRIVDTGITGVLEGARTGKYLVIRADLDALPINEKTPAITNQKIQG